MMNLTQWENLMRQIVLATVNPPLARQNDFVRFTWNAPQAGWAYDLDVCFVSVTPEVSDIERFRDQEYNNPTDTLKYTRVVRVDFIFYGTNAWENALNLKDALNYHTNTDLLRQNNLALITSSTSPVRMPELFNTHWYNKCTYSASFNELVIKEYTENYIETPVFELHTDPAMQE